MFHSSLSASRSFSLSQFSLKLFANHPAHPSCAAWLGFDYNLGLKVDQPNYHNILIIMIAEFLRFPPDPNASGGRISVSGGNLFSQSVRERESRLSRVLETSGSIIPHPCKVVFRFSQQRAAYGAPGSGNPLILADFLLLFVQLRGRYVKFACM